MKHRRALQKEEPEKHLEAVRLNVNEIYGGMIAGRGSDAGMPFLAASIARHGLLQPIVVKRNEEAARYQLLCGARRLAACRMLGHKMIDAVLYRGNSAVSCFVEEQETRLAPSFLDEAVLLKRKPRECADLVLPRQEAERRTAFLTLDEETQEEIRKSRLSVDQAEPLLLIEGTENRREAASIIASRELTPRQARRLVPHFEKREAPLKRRTVGEFVEAVSALCSRFRGKGVMTTMRICCHEGGLCVQILLKNPDNSSVMQEKENDNRIVKTWHEPL